jgi:hypothetical protein
MNNKTKRLAIGAAVVLLLVAVVKLVTLIPSGGSTNVSFPQRSESPTVVLKEDKFGEKLRLVQYAPDKKTRVSMRIERNDGGAARVDFGAGGKAVRMTEFYPAPQPDPAAKADGKPQQIVNPLADTLVNRTVMRVTDFAKDGESVALQNTYLPNGTLKEVAVITGEGNLLVTVYRDDQSGVERIQTFDKTTGVIKTERVFNEDGTIASSLSDQNVNYYTNAVQKNFNADGKVVRKVEFTSYDVTISDYSADGATLTQKTVYSYGDIIVTSYDTTGKRTLERRYNTTNGTIQVGYFSNEKQTFAQRWVKLDTTTVTPDRIGVVNQGYVISELAEYHSDGYTPKRQMVFYPGGKLVKAAELRPTQAWSPRFVKYYREDGSLDKTDEMEWSFVKKSTPMPAGPNDVRESIPADYLRVTPLFPGPAMDKSDMPVLAKRQLKYTFD